ncbi:MAG: homoserine dehydrogenase [Oscillibacter sp.]|nr:homoserine dehydrogenase [Oscillibacter sp.]
MYQIAIMGFGTVGTGVAKVIETNQESICRRLGEPLRVKSILVRHFKDGPYRSLMTDDFQTIESDKEISVVVETIGGVDAAYTYTKRALMAGKHVVTANKQLVAEHGNELLALAKEHHVNYLFEASVGGGIPVLPPLTQRLAANRIDEIYGILNGTTNYILTKMVQEGMPFSDALAQAQALGYAEADPTADVEGHDAGRKICILADLAFGRRFDPAVVPMEGISKIDLRDIKIAEDNGWHVKLLGRCLRLGEFERTAYVAPHLIREDNPVSHVNDVFNAVVVRGNATGEVMFYGKGAGELPTASACVSDVLECLLERPARPEIDWSEDTDGFVDPKEIPGRFYFRISGSIAEAEKLFGEVLVLKDGEESALIAGPMTESTAKQAASKLSVLAQMRVLD